MYHGKKVIHFHSVLGTKLFYDAPRMNQYPVARSNVREGAIRRNDISGEIHPGVVPIYAKNGPGKGNAHII